jgi:carboxypeptidase Taq
MNDSDKLRGELQRIAKYGSVLAVLNWDEEVNLPPGAHAYRAEVSALLSADLHKKITSEKFAGLVKKLNDSADKLTEDERAIAVNAWRDISRAQKLPTEFVEKLSRLTSEAFGVWAKARKAKDFGIYQSTLEQMIEMKREEAELVGYSDSPYDALLDEFEPNMTSRQLDELLIPLAEHISGLVKEAAGKAKPDLGGYLYDIAAQEKLTHDVSKKLGYDLSRGRIDISPHPFTTTFHTTDVRITTRYDDKDFWVALGSTIHEVGHGLYEQGLPAEYYGTPLAEAVSLGIHESQSRMWENFVGRSRDFSTYLQPLLKKYFASQKLAYSVDDLHKWLNRVEPNFIRVESDEVTYNLHIVLRYEIEKQLIEGKLKVAELPEVWNQKVKDYLGLDVPNDAMGVLQDVHWSHGAIGYFPTYTLGNLYAAQFFNTATQKLPKLKEGFSKGEFGPLLTWLRQAIHSQGRRYSAAELVKKVTGEELNPEFLKQHLEQIVKLS